MNTTPQNPPSMLLEIKDLSVALQPQSSGLSAEQAPKQILHALSLHIPLGEVHVMMGPNGSGKSSLAHFLVGHPSFSHQSGSVFFQGQDLLALSPQERAHAGLFLAFQYPLSFPGVSTVYLLKAALEAQAKAKGLPPPDAFECLERIKGHMRSLHISEDFLTRSLNEGFSGGEKKRHEMLQLLTLDPMLAILDETDSGLDIDALQSVITVLKELKSKGRSALVITHYPELVSHIKPDRVHIFKKGHIVESGDSHLAEKIALTGYQHYA